MFRSSMGLSIWVPQLNLYAETLVPSVILLEAGGHEGGVLMNRISVLIMETPESSQPLLPREDAARSCCQHPDRDPLWEHDRADTLILDFPDLSYFPTNHLPLSSQTNLSKL